MAKKDLIPPLAQQKPRKFKTHGLSRIDEYAWLRQSADPAVLSYIKAENDFADRFMKPTAAQQRKLFKEIKARMKEDDMSVPIKDGPYLYYTRTKKGMQYAIHCRKKGAAGREEVILDENNLARGKKYFSLGDYEVSPDHRLLAYSVDTTGAEKYALYIKDLTTGKLLSERIESVADFEWAEGEERYLFYTTEEHPHPPRKVFRHKVGEASETTSWSTKKPIFNGMYRSVKATTESISF
jgi:oligopeptidase B